MSKDEKPITYDHGPGSFAHNNRHILPGRSSKHDTGPSLSRDTFDNVRDPSIVLQKQDMRARSDSAYQNFMVKRSAPQHILRPPKAIAIAADRAAFSQRWYKERLHALRQQRPTAQAKKHFIDQRTSKAEDKKNPRNR